MSSVRMYYYRTKEHTDSVASIYSQTRTAISDISITKPQQARFLLVTGPHFTILSIHRHKSLQMLAYIRFQFVSLNIIDRSQSSHVQLKSCLSCYS